MCKGVQLGGIDGLHGALELGRVGEERLDLRLDESPDVLCVIRRVGFPQEQMTWTMVGDAVLPEEVRVAGCDDGIACEESGSSMVRVEPISLPWVVTEYD